MCCYCIIANGMLLPYAHQPTCFCGLPPPYLCLPHPCCPRCPLPPHPYRAAKLRDASLVAEELGNVLTYSRHLATFANEEDLVPGLGPVTVHGGGWGGRRGMAQSAYMEVGVEE